MENVVAKKCDAVRPAVGRIDGFTIVNNDGRAAGTNTN